MSATGPCLLRVAGRRDLDDLHGMARCRNCAATQSACQREFARASANSHWLRLQVDAIGGY